MRSVIYGMMEMGIPYGGFEWPVDPPTWPIYPAETTHVDFQYFTCPNCGYSIVTSQPFHFCPICSHPLTEEGRKKKSMDERLSNIEEMVQRILEGLEE